MRYFVFQSPWALAQLLILPPLAYVLGRAREKRTAVVSRLGGKTNAHLPARDGFRLAALALAIFALARPGIDPRVMSTEQASRDVVFALDVSRSMLAEDVVPSRLEAAKQAVRDVLVTLHGQRVGLVVYAGSASILCPLTDDYDFVRYMLDQANPATVDFGGTQWQFAVDKVTGQVFDSKRCGFSDLVLLTDGDDQGEGQERVAIALRDAGAGLLLVGLGDADAGAKIPVVDTDGRRSWIEEKGEAVRTRMNLQTLTALAASVSGAHFFEAGTAPFDLGKEFHDYTAKRPTGAPASGVTYTVYRELAFGMMPGVALLLALAQHWPLRWRRLVGASAAVVPAVFVFAMLLPRSVRAEEMTWRTEVAVAMNHQEAGRLEQAIEAWANLREPPSSVSAGERAVVALDYGLALTARATQSVTHSPTSAAKDASIAQEHFLAACRLDPSLVRAGQHLDTIAALMAEIQVRLDDEAQKNAETQSAVSTLVERLKALLKAQDALHARVPNLAKKHSPVALIPPEVVEVKDIVKTQVALNTDASAIRLEMGQLDRLLSAAEPGTPPVQSILQEPLAYMDKAIEAQARATEDLPSPDQWIRARQEQAIASGHLRTLLGLLSTNKPDDSGHGDDASKSDDDPADASSDDNPPAQSASLSAEGDKASASAMQPLPIPNYSVQDILKEEAANQQFRQQKRATAQAGKVEKDW
jgi:Ca-activated chloride channel homolog